MLKIAKIASNGCIFVTYIEVMVFAIRLYYNVGIQLYFFIGLIKYDMIWVYFTFFPKIYTKCTF